MLLASHTLPLFGILSRMRRRWPCAAVHSRDCDRVPMPSAGLLALSHACDLLRAEMTHFLVCLERYFRSNVIQEATRALEVNLSQLAEHLSSEESLPSTNFDVLEQARQLHAENLHLLTRDCLLAPGLRSVLSDAEHLLGLAAELHDTLEELVQQLRPRYVTDPADASTELGDVYGTDNEWREDALDLRSPDAIRAISRTSGVVHRIQRDFRQGATFLLKVLSFSVARGGTAPRVSDLCFQANFSSFYDKGL